MARTTMRRRPYCGRVRGGHPWVVPGVDTQNGTGARGASPARWRRRSLGFGHAAGLASGPAGAVHKGLRGRTGGLGWQACGAAVGLRTRAG
jgi:hypothetical protein